MHLPEMTDYEETCRAVRFDLPEHYNFGFDLIDERARRADKTGVRRGERGRRHGHRAHVRGSLPLLRPLRQRPADDRPPSAATSPT